MTPQEKIEYERDEKLADMNSAIAYSVIIFSFIAPFGLAVQVASWVLVRCLYSAEQIAKQGIYLANKNPMTFSNGDKVPEPYGFLWFLGSAVLWFACAIPVMSMVQMLLPAQYRLLIKSFNQKQECDPYRPKTSGQYTFLIVIATGLIWLLVRGVTQCVICLTLAIIAVLAAYRVPLANRQRARLP